MCKKTIKLIISQKLFKLILNIIKIGNLVNISILLHQQILICN